MLVLLLTTTMLLMFLAFGSVVLPIKAAVMSALTLGLDDGHPDLDLRRRALLQAG